MNLPGFHAESALQPIAGNFRSTGPIAGRSAVEPAAPCCSFCVEACQLYPQSSFCKGCQRNPCNSRC